MVESNAETKVRDNTGKFKKQDELIESTVAEIENDPGMIARLMARLQTSPVMSTMVDSNITASKQAAKGKAGELILTRIRENLLRPAIPEQFRASLDNPLIVGAVDLGLGNLLLFLGAQFQDKLPERARPYALAAGECCVYAAYNKTFGAIDLEGFFMKLVSGDIADLLKDVVPTNK